MNPGAGEHIMDPAVPFQCEGWNSFFCENDPNDGMVQIMEWAVELLLRFVTRGGWVGLGRTPLGVGQSGYPSGGGAFFYFRREAPKFFFFGS